MVTKCPLFQDFGVHLSLVAWRAMDYAERMMILRSAGLIASLSCAFAVSACSAASAGDDDLGATSAELRELTPEEILGEIHYGDTVAVDYTSTPRYRAFWFQGTKGDWLNVKVTSSTGAVDAFVTDNAYHTVRRGTRGVLRKTGKYFIAVRSDDLN